MRMSYGQLVLNLAWLLFFFLLLMHFYRKRSLLVNAKSWLITKGHITQFDWVKVGHNIWPKIEYSYEVHDKEIIGSYLFLDTTHNNPNSRYSRGVAYKAALAYKDNVAIDVHYNPNTPEESALDVTIPIKLNVIIGLLSIIILVQLGIMLYSFLH